MERLSHFQHEEEISEHGAADLIRAGLKAMLIRAHREERDRRVTALMRE